MSDVGLGANLELSITDALRRVDQLGQSLTHAAEVRVQVDTSSVAPEITRAVDAANTEATVEADTTSVAPEITRAVDAADSGIVVDADTTDVAPSISGAVDAADSAVVITADAADVTGSIDGAVQAADTSVTVEGSIDPGLLAATDQLADGIDAAAESGISLKRILATVSVGATIAGLRSLAEAGSDLAESTSKAGVVFGTEFPAIERFAVGAADAVGLSTQAALEAAGTFGNLFQALGTSREEAARLSPQVVQLAGDLASFNNIGTDEALEKLRSGLVGEIEPLRALGVSFNALQVDAKAAELGLGAVGRGLTEGEKVQARYALIVEQTTLAQGDFARTAEGLANQQRILKAELANAAAAAGTLLLPAFLALGDAGRDAIPKLSELGERVLPAVGSALENLAPLLGTSLDILIALSPVIQLAAMALGSIPSPVIQVVAGLLVMNKVLAISHALAASSALTGLGATLIAAGRGAMVAAGGFAAAGGGAAGLSAALGTLSLAALGPTAALAAIIGSVVLYNKVMGDAKQEGVDFGASLRASFDPATASLSELRDASADLDDKIVQLKGDVDDSFLGRNGVNRDFNAALNEGISQAEQFQIEIDDAAEALERAAAVAEFAPLIAGLVDTGEAFGRLREESASAAGAVSSLRLGVESSDADFLSLALALDEAALSEEGMADAAALLGTDVESLKGFIEEATAALTAFVDTSVAALPTVSDAFANVGEDSILSVREFRQGLDDEADNMRAFTLRLAALAQEGFGELAGVIAQQGPEIGGALVTELVTALGDGNRVLVEQTQASLDNFNGAWTDTTTYLRDVLGPEFVLTTGLIGSAASTTFGENLTFGERLRIAGEIAALQMDESGKAVAAIAATEGADAARRYGDALNLDDRTVAAAIAAGEAIKNNAPVGAAKAAGSLMGQGFHQGFVDGMSLGGSFDIAIAAANLVAQAEQAARRAAGAQSPSRLFAALGRDLGDGVALGIDESGSSVVAAAEAIVRDAAAAVGRVSPEVTASITGDSGAGGAGAGGLVVSFDVTVNPPAGMTKTEAAAIGEAIVDGATERLAERRLAVATRAQA